MDYKLLQNVICSSKSENGLEVTKHCPMSVNSSDKSMTDNTEISRASGEYLNSEPSTDKNKRRPQTSFLQRVIIWKHPKPLKQEDLNFKRDVSKLNSKQDESVENTDNLLTAVQKTCKFEQDSLIDEMEKVDNKYLRSLEEMKFLKSKYLSLTANKLKFQIQKHEIEKERKLRKINHSKDDEIKCTRRLQRQESVLENCVQNVEPSLERIENISTGHQEEDKLRNEVVQLDSNVPEIKIDLNAQRRAETATIKAEIKVLSQDLGCQKQIHENIKSKLNSVIKNNEEDKNTLLEKEKNALKNCKESIKNLQEDTKLIRNQINEKEHELRSLNIFIVSLSKEIDEHEKEYQKAIEKKEEKQKEICSSKQYIENCDKIVYDLAQVIHLKTGKIKEGEELLKTLNFKMDNLKTEIRTKDQELIEEKKLNEKSLKKEMQYYQKINYDLLVEVELIKNEMQVKEDQLKYLKTSVENIENDIEKYQQILESKQIIKSEKQLQVQASSDALNIAINYLKKDCNTNLTLKKELQRKLAELKDAKTKLLNEEKFLQNEIKNIRNGKLRKEKDYKYLKSDFIELSSKILNMESQNKNLLKQLVEFQKRNLELESELKSLQCIQNHSTQSNESDCKCRETAGDEISENENELQTSSENKNPTCPQSREIFNLKNEETENTEIKFYSEIESKHSLPASVSEGELKLLTTSEDESPTCSQNTEVSNLDNVGQQNAGNGIYSQINFNHYRENAFDHVPDCELKCRKSSGNSDIFNLKTEESENEQIEIDGNTKTHHIIEGSIEIIEGIDTNRENNKKVSNDNVTIKRKKRSLSIQLRSLLFVDTKKGNST